MLRWSRLFEQLPHRLAGGLQLAVDGCVGLGRTETQASQEVTSFTIDRIHETALKTSRQIYCYSRSSAVFKPFSKFLGATVFGRPRVISANSRTVGTVLRRHSVPRYHFLEGSSHTEVQFSGAPVKIGGIESSYPIFARDNCTSPRIFNSSGRAGSRFAQEGRWTGNYTNPE